jgi:hypothetical protein
MRQLVVFLLCLCFWSSADAQPLQASTVRIEVRHGDAAMPGIPLTVNGAVHVTAADGRVSVTVPPGSVEIALALEGFMPATTTLTIAAGDQREVVITLQPQHREEITVSATRTDKRLEDQPMRG